MRGGPTATDVRGKGALQRITMKRCSAHTARDKKCAKGNVERAEGVCVLVASENERGRIQEGPATRRENDGEHHGDGETPSLGPDRVGACGERSSQRGFRLVKTRSEGVRTAAACTRTASIAAARCKFDGMRVG